LNASSICVACINTQFKTPAGPASCTNCTFSTGCATCVAATGVCASCAASYKFISSNSTC